MTCGGPGAVVAADLLDGDQDDVAGHDLDDVDLQQPPDEELQLVEVLQELEEEHRQPVHHQVPFVLQVWSRRRVGEEEHTRIGHAKKAKTQGMEKQVVPYCRHGIGL